MLRAFVELAQNVVAALWMKPAHCELVIGTQAMPAVPPEEKTDTTEETELAAASSSTKALILGRLKAVSKDEGVLTTVSHTAPSRSVSLVPQAIRLPLPSRRRQACLSRDAGGRGNCLHRSKAGEVRSGREADELVQWTNSSDERPMLKRRAGPPRLRGEKEGAHPQRTAL